MSFHRPRHQDEALLGSTIKRLLIVAFAAIFSAATAHAQEESTDDPWVGVEEMLVVGSGTVGALLAAPTSVAAFDAEDLAAMGSQNIGDIAEFTPNLEITSPFAASNPQLFIRGVGLQDSNSNAASAVAVVIDRVYMSSPAGQLSQLFDVTNLEVLRGPQGALYGRNASAGVIRVTSNKPVQEYAAGVTTTYGRYKQFDIDGFLNVPLVPDLLATRVAFKYASRDFLGENRCNRFYDVDDRLNGQVSRLSGTKCNYGLTIEPTFPQNGGNAPLPRPEAGVNNRENWAMRNLWLFTPNEDWSVLFNVHGTQNLGRAPSFQLRGTSPVFVGGNRQLDGIATDANNYLDIDTCVERSRAGACVRADLDPGGGSPFSGDYSRVGDERLTAIGSSITADWTSGPWRVESVFAWEYNDREALIDIDASPYVAAESFFEDTATEYFADTRLIWNDDSGLELLLGATALYDRLGASNRVFVASNNFLSQEITQKTWHAALFGHLEWEITENVILQGGVRVNYERKSFELTSGVRRLENNQETPATTPKQNDRALAEEFRPSGEIVLRYEPTSDMKYYWRFSRGYKGRHFNGTAVFPGTPIDPVQPEFVNSFEIGWSMNFFEGAIAWNGAGFFYDYENQQVFQLQDSPDTAFPVNTLINAEDSRLIGGETDITFRWEGLEIAQSIGIQYSEFSDFRNVQREDRISPGGDLVTTFRVDDFSGNQLVNSPELSYVSYAQYRWEWPAFGTFIPRFDWRYKSRVFYTPENDSRIGADPRWIFDVRLTYRNLEGNVEISGWVRNLTDELYPVTAFDRKDGNGAIVWVISDPRTYGVTASFRF